MKKTLTCPKCDGRKIWRIDQLKEQTYGNMRRVDPLHVSLKVGFWGAKGTGSFAVFVCAGCGYSEFYATGIESLQSDPKNGVYFIDNEPVAGLR
jgi:predicted nucleic-acid-binding Zn-ribbon protein